MARVEDRTFICSSRQEDAGPTNNWADPPHEAEASWPLRWLHARTHHVRCSVQHGAHRLAHRPHRRAIDRFSVCGRVSMRIMTRMGAAVLDGRWATTASSPACTPSARPSWPGQKDVPWPCNQETSTSSISPRNARSGPYGSGYGGNALLGKKCFALRIASVHGARRGLAGRAHADPRRRASRRAENLCRRRVPQRLRQDQFRHAHPAGAIQGRLESHHRRRRHRLDEARRRDRPAPTRSTPRRATSASRPGPAASTNPNAMATMRRDTIFTNVALTADGDVWWEGNDRNRRREDCIDWRGSIGRRDRQGDRRKAAHPNSRFTAPMANNPALATRRPMTRRRARSAPSSSAAAAPNDPAGLPGVQLDSRRLPRRHHGLRDDRRRHRAAVGRPPRSDGHAPVLRLQHGRLSSSTGSACASD